MEWELPPLNRWTRPGRHKPRPMRIPSFLLKSVGFIGEHLADDPDSGGAFHEWHGTEFLVSSETPIIRADQRGFRFYYFVTARHVAEALYDRKIACIVNSKAGGVDSIMPIGNRWYFHPTDDSVDVAVFPFNLRLDLDVAAVPVSAFMRREDLDGDQIGIGDEVFTVGLFSDSPGTSRNQPIVRHGNLAMVPDAPMQIGSKFSEVYLIEARSIGGLSGSPVFARPTMHIIFGDEDNESDQQCVYGVGHGLKLLGLAHGHWDIRESEINQQRMVPSARGVNMGIGVVVPAHKILEVINHPELVAMCKRAEQRWMEGVSPTPD